VEAMSRYKLLVSRTMPTNNKYQY